MRIQSLLILALGSAATVAGAQVSVNAVISGPVVPGVYGQVVIGHGGPPPPVVYAQPVVAEPAPVVVGAPPPPPLYLHVPPGHAKHWREHCHEYHACNRPVYFVRSAEYEPGFDMDRWRREHHDHDHDRDHHEHGDHDDRDHGDRDH